MLSRLGMFGLTGARSLPSYAARGQDLACLVTGQVRRYHEFARKEMTERWETPRFQDAARALTQATVVETTHTSRLPIPSGKQEHGSTKYARASHWDPTERCAIDRLAATCPEELLWFRLAVGASRFPKKIILEVAQEVGQCIASDFAALSPEARSTLLAVGSVRDESRSQDLLADANELFRILYHPESVSPQKFLRALEVVSSPLGNIMNAYGDPKDGGKAQNWKFKTFLENCKDPMLIRSAHDLDDFLRKKLMDPCFEFHIPHIRAKGSAYDNVKWYSETKWQEIVNDALKNGGKVPGEGIRTRIMAIENCDSTGTYPKLPDGIILDNTTLTRELYHNMHSSHYYNVSGTTGNLMQVTCGILHMHGKLGLIYNPDMTGMYATLVAGAQFQKNGFHSWHEVSQAVRYINKVLHKEAYSHPTAAQVVADARDLVVSIVDPKSTMAPKVADVAEIVAENQLELDRLAKKHDTQLLKAEEQAQSSGPSPQSL